MTMHAKRCRFGDKGFTVDGFVVHECTEYPHVSTISYSSITACTLQLAWDTLDGVGPRPSVLLMLRGTWEPLTFENETQARDAYAAISRAISGVGDA
jgi:hypothetical protein